MDVLNAFRHQRMVTRRVQLRSTCRSQVLNAFRHQRMVHQEPVNSSSKLSWCSTPFGIKGWSTLIGKCLLLAQV